MQTRTYFYSLGMLVGFSAATMAYIYGYRVVDYSELPNSQRPRTITVSATASTPAPAPVRLSHNAKGKPVANFGDDLTELDAVLHMAAQGRVPK